jgi:hypothetical protein
VVTNDTEIGDLDDVCDHFSNQISDRFGVVREAEGGDQGAP